MAKIFIDLSEDEQYCDGKMHARILDKDTLTGTESALMIGDEIEIVLSVRQLITLFDLVDGWLHGGAIVFAGDAERRIREAIKTTIDEHGSAVRAINSKPEELAQVIYENMKFHGIRFRFVDEEENRAERYEKWRESRKPNK